MNERWAPGIGDPSLMGWVTVACYAIAAVACLRAAAPYAAAPYAAAPHSGAQRAGGEGASSNRNSRTFWLILAVMLAALGVNKQLDLQSLLTQVVRDLAKARGWYEQRRAMQGWFVAGVALVGVSILSSGMLHLRRADGGRRLAFGGLVLIFAYVLMRAASFHHMDWAINQTLLSVKVNWIVEIGGLILVTLGAHRSSGLRII